MPDVLSYVPRPGLSDRQREVEARFARHLAKDFPGAIRKYRRIFGNVIDRNNAQELSADYNRNRESRQRNALATHEPAGALAQAVYLQMLAEKVPAGRNLVIFSAGGQGSGKTTALRYSGLERDAQIIMDGTLQNYETSLRNVRAALAHGKRVTIFYVYRPFGEAVENIIQRAANFENGRVVEVKRAASGHYRAPRTVLKLMEDFLGNGELAVKFADNTGNHFREMTREELESLLPHSIDGLCAEGYKRVDDYFAKNGPKNRALTAELRRLLQDVDAGSSR